MTVETMLAIPGTLCGGPDDRHTPVHETPDVVAAAVLDVVGRSLTANRLRHR